MNKLGVIINIFLLLTVPITVCQAVEAPYQGYVYNVWREAVPSPNGYLPERSITGEDLGVGSFKEPQDFFVDRQKNIYILDSGNNRIVVLDEHFKKKAIIDQFYGENGPETIVLPTGIFVTPEGLIYLADGKKGRVVKVNQEGRILQEYRRPESELIPAHIEYVPIKVLVDSSGTIYTIIKDLYYGAVMYNQAGEFLGYYGTNRVVTTLQLLQDFIWKKILTKTQRDKMARYVPVAFANFTIDEKDFVYTCTQGTTTNSSLKKYNPMGVNILRGRNGTLADYGDLETEYYAEHSKTYRTQFVDLVVDENGFINALDYTFGRVFQYNQDSELLTIFGGLGSQLGLFKTPVAIESINGKIMVLDAGKNNITLFAPTEFGQAVHTAVKLYDDGLYEESIEPWLEVLKRNSNYELAYIGIAQAMMRIGNYEEAMKYYKLGYDREGYSKAYREYRTEVLRENFSLVMFFMLLIIVLIQLFLKKDEILRKIGRQRKRYGD